MARPKTVLESHEKTLSIDQFPAALRAMLVSVEKGVEHIPGAHERQGNPGPIAPRVPEASVWTEKMISRATAAGDAWKKGAMAPRKDPQQAAIAAIPKWKAKMAAAISSGAYDAGVKNYDINMMEQVISQTDPSKYAAGIQSRSGKIGAAIGKLRPRVLALATTIDSMADTTDQDRENRALAGIRGMKAIGQQMKQTK